MLKELLGCWKHGDADWVALTERRGIPGEAVEALASSPYFALGISSTWLSLFFYNKAVIYKVNCFLQYYELLNPKRGLWEPLWLTASWSETEVTIWIWDWCLKWGQSCGTKPFTCAIWHSLHVEGVRIELNSTQPVLENWSVWGKTHTSGVTGEVFSEWYKGNPKLFPSTPQVILTCSPSWQTLR